MTQIGFVLNRRSISSIFFNDKILNALKVLDPKFKESLCIDKTTFDIWSKDILDNSKIDYSKDIVTDSYINIKKLSNKGIDELRNKKFLLARKIDKDTEVNINYIVN